MKTGIILGQVVILLFLMGMAGANFLYGFDPDTYIFPACVFLVLMSAWSLYSWKRTAGSLFDPYVLFFVAAVLFNGGQALLEVFHLNEYGMLARYNFSSDTMLRTLYLVILGLAFFHFGALINAWRKGKKKNLRNSHADTERAYSTEKALLRVGWILLCVAFVPTVLVFKEAIQIVLSRGYFGLYETAPDIGLSGWHNVLSAFIVPASLLLLAGSTRSTVARGSSVAVIGVYVLIMLFFGWRSKAVMSAVAYLWLWHRTVRPLPATVIAVVGTSAFFLFPVIKIIRDIPGSERLSLPLYLHQFFLLDNPIIATVSEFGITMRNVAFTVDLVPLTRPFALGLSYLYALLTLVPNLFWAIHPSQAYHLGTWLTSTVAPRYFAAGGGYGYSFLAEAYLNFGWLGLPLALGLMGYYYSKFTLWAQRQDDPARLAVVACFLSFFLFFVRAESMSVVRPFVWYSLIPYMAVRWLARRSVPKTVHRSGPVY